MELFNEKDVSELISIRRELHQIAEVGLAEYKTSAFIRQHLQELDNVSLDEVLVGLPTAVIARISVTTTA